MFDIIYEDNHILVISKPVGLLSQSDIKKQKSLYDYLKDYLKERKQKDNVYLAIVHRLDRNTGGIMIFAKTSKSAKRLSEQFQKRQIKKKYLVVTYNIPILGLSGVMKNYMIKNEKKRLAILSKENNPYAKLAELEYHHLETISYQKRSFYKFIVYPKTGRFHQIRFQFAQNKAPLLGDRKYGSDTTIQYPALWAYEIEFYHPINKQIMKYRCEPPINWPFN